MIHFMGRGATPLQAALMGRYAIGNDVNPLSIIAFSIRLSHCFCWNLAFEALAIAENVEGSGYERRDNFIL